MAGPYVHPVPGAAVKRLDQGIDFQGKPGQPVLAVGNAHVDYVKDDPGGFGKVVYYTLLDGAYAGQQFYVGHAKPAVTAGQTVSAGQPVAVLTRRGGGNASGLSGWTEIGFAKGGVPEPVSAQRFKQFLSTTVTGASPAAAPGGNGAPSSPQAPAAPAPVTDPYHPPPLGPPTVAPPDALPPGTSGAGALPARLVAANWQQIAATQDPSPDTLGWLQNAQTATGG